MPRPKSPELSERQRDIVELTHNGHTAAEIADLLGVVPGTVYQAQSRLRKMGALPPSDPSKLRGAAAAAVEAASNGGEPDSDSIEEQIGEEIGRIGTRLETIELETKAMTEEHDDLTRRLDRLENAQRVLTGAATK